MKNRKLNFLGRKFAKTVSTAMVFTMLVGTTVSAQTLTIKDVFDAEYYSQTYSDLSEAFGTNAEKLYNHYIHYGQAEERSFTPLIDLKKYRAAYADLDAAFGDDWNAYLNHYLVYGINEGRNSYGVFDAIAYADRYSDLREAFGYDVLALYQHYITFGANEGREGGTTAAADNASGGSASNSNASGNNSSANTPSENGNGSGHAPSESGNGSGYAPSESGNGSANTNSGAGQENAGGNGSQSTPGSGEGTGSADNGSQSTPGSSEGTGSTDNGSQSTPGSSEGTGSTDNGNSGFVTDPAGIETFGVNTTYHTVAEIRSYMQNSGANVNNDTTVTGCSLSAPYAAGTVSEQDLTEALAMLNQIRYIAGLDADVTLNSAYTEKVQTGSLVNAANNELTHFPACPAGMSEDMYNLGQSGTSSSNIAWTSWQTTLSYSVLSWMDDSDASNIDRVGHRRWILNPSMKQTGFGYVYAADRGTYSSVYAFDESGRTDQNGVAWPAREMPVQYFSNSMAWSWSYGQSLGDVTVTLQCLNTDKAQTWNFSSGSADFYVNNVNYGQPGCVIFRPAGISIAAGDVYLVTITNNGSELAKYTVSFFE